MNTLSIHQPNFLPWIGFFNKLNRSDSFVYFDHVQAPLGRSWINRNKILLNNKSLWLTIPIKKSKRALQKIHDVEIAYEQNFKKKHLGTIKQAYLKSQYFDEIFSLINLIYDKNHVLLSDFNKDFIEEVCKILDINLTFTSTQEMIKQGSLDPTLNGNELVLEICKVLKPKKYLSGDGCLDFILPQSFNDEGIEFQFQNYKHPEYKQLSNEFVPNMSIIDAMFNLGVEGTKELLK